ncbi:MAG TPA: hypothetical protein VMV92_12295 [Streptosporangiaceae bacterium]|nr:hypothetical protein [Streptosporangiaceae bacterium]
MEAREEQLAHLERLVQALDPDGFTAEIIGAFSSPYLKVANASAPSLNERIYCGRAEDGTWLFRWPWHQPIGSVDDLEKVADKVTEVLRSVGKP